jgi:hydroxylamine dehydrogenase
MYRNGIVKKPEGWKYAPDLLQYYDAKTSIEQELCLIMLEYRQINEKELRVRVMILIG